MLLLVLGETGGNRICLREHDVAGLDWLNPPESKYTGGDAAATDAEAVAAAAAAMRSNAFFYVSGKRQPAKPPTGIYNKVQVYIEGICMYFTRLHRPYCTRSNTVQCSAHHSKTASVVRAATTLGRRVAVG